MCPLLPSSYRVEAPAPQKINALFLKVTKEDSWNSQISSSIPELFSGTRPRCVFYDKHLPAPMRQLKKRETARMAHHFTGLLLPEGSLATYGCCNYRDQTSIKLVKSQCLQAIYIQTDQKSVLVHRNHQGTTFLTSTQRIPLNHLSSDPLFYLVGNLDLWP